MIFRTLSDRTTVLHVSVARTLPIGPKLSMLTFIFANIFEGEGQASILPLDDANLSKSTFPHHSQESEMVEIDCCERECQHTCLPGGTSVRRGGEEGW